MGSIEAMGIKATSLIRMMEAIAANSMIKTTSLTSDMIKIVTYNTAVLINHHKITR